MQSRYLRQMITEICGSATIFFVLFGKRTTIQENGAGQTSHFGHFSRSELSQVAV